LIITAFTSTHHITGIVEELLPKIR
jgi:hypothetical protein